MGVRLIFGNGILTVFFFSRYSRVVTELVVLELVVKLTTSVLSGTKLYGRVRHVYPKIDELF